MEGQLYILLLVIVCGMTEAFRGGPEDNEGTRSGYACEGATLTIDCGSQNGKDKKIFVVRANYGRQNIGICNDGSDTSSWNLQCISTRAARTVARMCNETQICSVTASNVHFGGDPCPGTLKYLEMEYYCLGDRAGYGTPTLPPVTVAENTTTVSTSTTATTTTTRTTATTYKTGTTTTTPKPKYTTKSPPIKTTKSAPPPPPLLLTTTTTSPIQGDQGVPSHYCEADYVRGIKWPRTYKGSWAIMTCPNNPEVRRAMRKCSRHIVRWEGLPDLSGCKSPEVEDLARKMALAREDFSSEIVTEVASELEHASGKEDLFGGDIKTMSKIMKEMVTEVETQAKNVTKPVSDKLVHDVTQSVLNTSSNILSSEKQDSWTDLPQATQAETATRLISSVEDSAYQLADTYQQPAVVINVTLNIVLEVNVVNTESEVVQDVVFPSAATSSKSRGSDLMDTGNSIRLSGNSLKQLSVDGLARLIFLTYNNLERWLQPRPIPAATSYGGRYGDYGTPYQEFRAPDPVMFDPGEIEMNVGDSVRELPVRDMHDDNLPPTYHQGNKLQPDNTQPQGLPDRVKVDAEVKMTPDHKTTVTTSTTTTTTTTTTTPTPTTSVTTEALETVAPTEDERNMTSRVVNSKIISASVLQKQNNPDGTGTKSKGHVNLTEPVYYTLEHRTKDNVYNPTCAFWEYSEKTMSGGWSTFGCDVHETNVTHTTCACNHLTNFAVLMNVKGVTLRPADEFALAFITYMGCVISIVCLIICFITFAAFKNLQCDRNTIHKNLVLCLLIAEILFLAGIMQHKNPLVCSVMAGFLHFFFLAAFMWMLIEGVQLYVMLVEVFEAEKSRVKYYYLVSYGTPAIIVAISAAINHKGYGTETHCWLTTEGGFIWAFVGPVVVIITVNIIMLSIAIYQMCKHANAAAGWKMKQKSKMESIRSWVKGASVLVVLLGLTWTFGLLYVNQHTTFMAYIFTILNSLQGLFIFVFHCAMNEKVQKEYKRWVRHATWLPETLRVKYGGAKPYASTTPNQSSSSGNYLTRLLSGRRRKRSSTTTVRSSESNGSKWHYQNMKHDPTSPRESGHLSDSGIVRNADSVCNTEDQGGYLEPVSIRVNDNLLGDIEDDPGFSLMEGSCVDTDCYGVEYNKKPTLDVDKYKIKSPQNRLSALSKERPISESDYSDGELLKMTDTGSIHDYEEIPRTKSEQALVDSMDNEGYDTLLQRKLRQFAQENENNVPKDVPNMNNLDKGDNGNEAVRNSLLLNMPNIQFNKEESFKRSLPSLQDSNKLPVVIEKLNKQLSTSDDGMMTIHRNTDKKTNDFNIPTSSDC